MLLASRVSKDEWLLSEWYYHLIEDKFFVTYAVTNTATLEERRHTDEIYSDIPWTKERAVTALEAGAL